MEFDAARFSVRLAASDREIEAAQRLRYDVFVREMGAEAPDADHDAGVERDRFDPYFDHLLLIDTTRQTGDPKDYVVGVYRLMRDDAAACGPGHYSAPEFNLAPLQSSGRKLLELGRSCIARDYRGGVALQVLWQGLAAYVLEHDIEVLFGVASFKGTDRAAHDQALAFLHHRHLAEPALRVSAKAPGRIPMATVDDGSVTHAEAMKQLPNLIKSYLRLGGVVGDGAFVDHEFNTIDVCLILDTARMAERARAQLTDVALGRR